MPRYIRWDYDNKIATEFERQGDCNGCGACCRALIEFRVHGNLQDDDPRNLGDGVAVDAEGIWAEVSDDENRRYFQVTTIDHHPEEKPCSKLGEDKKCMVHFDKPRICSVWPVIPDQVTPFPDCSYSFNEIQRWQFELIVETEPAE
jgi:Fe-S-cluster containining protein